MVHLVKLLDMDNKEICKVTASQAQCYFRRQIAVIVEPGICPALPISITVNSKFPIAELEKLKNLGGN